MALILTEPGLTAAHTAHPELVEGWTVIGRVAHPELVEGWPRVAGRTAAADRPQPIPVDPATYGEGGG